MHIQTLAALEPEADSYEALILVCRKLGLSDQAVAEVYRRMVFNILANNTDDHNKNFTFMMDQLGHWSLAPAYDMTFIFDLGGFTANIDHCLRMRGKLRGHTYSDLIEFAQDNGIKGAEGIIADVSKALLTFRTKAIANGIALSWIGRIEHSLNQNLRRMDLLPAKDLGYFTINGHQISNLTIEPAYKGNYHLNATIDGSPARFIFTKKYPEYQQFDTIGVENLSTDFFIHCIRNFLPVIETK